MKDPILTTNARPKRKRKRKVDKQPQPTMIGTIVDLPLADFEKELVRQKVNIGTINNLILNLEGAYNELRMRKDAIINMKFRGTLVESHANSMLKGLYAEMIKVEQKITYLKQRSKELVDVDKTPN